MPGIPSPFEESFSFRTPFFYSTLPLRATTVSHLEIVRRPSLTIQTHSPFRSRVGLSILISGNGLKRLSYHSTLRVKYRRASRLSTGSLRTLFPGIRLSQANLSAFPPRCGHAYSVSRMRSNPKNLAEWQIPFTTPASPISPPVAMSHLTASCPATGRMHGDP